jgi:hypothetical protein
MAGLRRPQHSFFRAVFPVVVLLRDLRFLSGEMAELRQLHADTNLKNRKAPPENTGPTSHAYSGQDNMRDGVFMSNLSSRRNKVLKKL